MDTHAVAHEVLLKIYQKQSLHSSGNANTDIDFDARGEDSVDVTDLHEIYDIGADEFNVNHDFILEDDFEES